MVLESRRKVVLDPGPLEISSSSSGLGARSLRPALNPSGSFPESARLFSRALFASKPFLLPKSGRYGTERQIVSSLNGRSMKRITLALVLLSLLAGSACSRKKEAAKEPATPAPVDTNEMKSRMEAQQQAIKNASDQLQKRQELQTPTPTPSVPPG